MPSRNEIRGMDNGYSQPEMEEELRNLISEKKPDDGGDDNDNTPEQDTSRIVRLIFYFVLYGVVLEISLLIARYQRHHDTHDEYHGFLMFIVCVGGLGFDLWYILANLDNLFTGFWARMKVGFIIGVTLFFFIQIYLGVQTRVTMRVLEYEPKYYSRRSFHVTIGILLWIGTKAKLWLICKIEDEKEKISFDLDMAALIYFGVILIVRVVLEAFLKMNHSKFRNGTIKMDKNLFNSQIKKKHGQLLDFMGVKYLEDINSLFTELNFVTIEDRVFDIKDLDHPGGRFILPKLTGRDISRYFYGSQSFDLFGKSVMIKHAHSALAFNYLEKRFIGFMDPAKIIIKKDGFRGSINDMRMSVASFKEIDDQRQETYRRMDNGFIKFTYKIASSEPIKPYIAIIYFKSEDHKFSTEPDPFLSFGRYFNLRIMNKSGCRQYSCVMSLSPDHIQFRQGLFKKFLNLSQLYSEERYDLSTTTLEFPNTSIDALPLVIKKYSNSKGFSRKIYTAQQNQKLYEIRGPFGVGLSIKKFSYGKYCLFGMGTGNNAFIDLFDFLARKMIYDYTEEFHGEEKAKEMDPWKSDFDVIFKNDIQLNFYMSFKTGTEFEKLFGENLKMICKIKEKMKTNVVNKILVRYTEKNGLNHSNYPGIDFLENKIKPGVMKTFLSRLGVNFGNKKCDLTKAIVVGSKAFSTIISEGLKNNGIPEEKLHLV